MVNVDGEDDEAGIDRITHDPVGLLRDTATGRAASL